MNPEGIKICEPKLYGNATVEERGEKKRKNHLVLWKGGKK